MYPMLDWIARNSDLIQTFTGIVTALVWVVYLHLLVMNVSNSRRPNILISRGGSSAGESRCLVGNMGAEPIFVVSMIADLRIDGQVRTAVVTDRDEFAASEFATPADATNQGPLESGAYMDAGSFTDIVGRAARYSEDIADEQDIRSIELTVIAATGSSGRIAAGRRCFNIGWKDGARVYIPAAVTTTQIHSVLARHRLRRRLRRAIDVEARQLTVRPGLSRNRA